MAEWVSAFIAFVALAHSIWTARKNADLTKRVNILQTTINNQSISNGGGGGGGIGGAGGDGGSVYIGENS
jgi:uncharacterized membrane protein